MHANAMQRALLPLDWTLEEEITDFDWRLEMKIH